MECTYKLADNTHDSKNAEICVPVCQCTDLVQLSVGAENKGQDVKHFDPYHTASLVPFRETAGKKEVDRKEHSRGEARQGLRIIKDKENTKR